MPDIRIMGFVWLVSQNPCRPSVSSFTSLRNLSLYKKFQNFVFFSHFDLIFLREGSCLPLRTYEKKTFRIINQLAQLTQLFQNVGSFLNADLNFSTKAAIYH